MVSEKNIHTFTPKNCEPVTLDKTTLYLYPRITPTMSAPEKQYALMVNKAVLEDSDIPPSTALQTYGERTNSQSSIGILQERHIAFAKQYILSASQFTVLSYHGKNGRVIADCMLANDELKPTTNIANADRRPANIHFAKLNSDIRFTSIDAANTQVYPFSFFIRLQCQTLPVTGPAGGNAGNLTSFHGPDGWAQSADQAVIDAVVNFTGSIQKPFYLHSPTIEGDTVADAVIEVHHCGRDLKTLALRAVWRPITEFVFKSCCPNLEQDPVQVIQECHQEVTDPVTQAKTFQTVDQYYQLIFRLAAFLPKSRDWQLDVVQHFITHLKKEIRDILNSATSTFKYNCVAAAIGLKSLI